MVRPFVGPAFGAAALLLAAPFAAAAEVADDLDDPTKWLKELDLTAGVVEADLKLRELELRDDVRVRLSPYYLRAQRIHLSLGKWGVRVVGNGILGFCPCEDPPVSIGFSGGWAGPPDELIVENPTLRIAGVPIFWLPYLWLRSPRKIGLGLPEVAFRGLDGLFLGQTLHLPISKGMEIGVGGYTRAGFGASLDFATNETITRIRFDARSASAVAGSASPSGVGLSLDIRGDAGDRAHVAWDVNALRGARAARTTLDRGTLALPYDRAAVAARVGPAGLGIDMLGVRGGSLGRVDIYNPYVSLGQAFAVGEAGGGFLASSFGPRVRSGISTDLVADATVGLALGGGLSVFSWSGTARLDGRGARGDVRAYAGVAEARLELSLPLARAIALERAKGGPPVVHILEPLVRLSALAAGAHAAADAGLLGFVGRNAIESGHALVAAAGLRTMLGTTGLAPGLDPWIGALRGEVAVGAIVAANKDAVAAFELSHATRDGGGGRFGLTLSGAVTHPFTTGPFGAVGLARLQWDASRDGFGLELRGAARDSVPVLAALTVLGAEIGPRLGQTAFLKSSGVTAGTGVYLPRFFGLRLGAEVDGFRGGDGVQLLEARGVLRYRHPCGCFRLNVRGGHVVGRDGVDVMASADLTERR